MKHFYKYGLYYRSDRSSEINQKGKHFSWIVLNPRLHKHNNMSHLSYHEFSLWLQLSLFHSCAGILTNSASHVGLKTHRDYIKTMKINTNSVERVNFEGSIFSESFSSFRYSDMRIGWLVSGISFSVVSRLKGMNKFAFQTPYSVRSRLNANFWQIFVCILDPLKCNSDVDSDNTRWPIMELCNITSPRVQ